MPFLAFFLSDHRAILQSRQWVSVTAAMPPTVMTRRTLHSPTVPSELRGDSLGNVGSSWEVPRTSLLPNQNSTTQRLFMNQDFAGKFQGSSLVYWESIETSMWESHLSPLLDSLELTRTLPSHSLPGQKSTMLHTSLSSQNFLSDSTESVLTP